MSWDEYKQTSACPCGTGTYTITRHENDWGKTHESLEMNCTDCRARYLQFSHSYHDTGAPSGLSAMFLWVLRRDKEAVDDIEQEIEREKQSIVAIARTRYLRRWLAHFAGKSKKDVWAQLRSINRLGVPSLSTFYDHTQGEGVEQYLHHWFEAERLIPILTFLDVADPEITEATKRLFALGGQYEAARNEMVRKGVFAS